MVESLGTQMAGSLDDSWAVLMVFSLDHLTVG